ncbi:hypothetical protein CRUP_022896, partial [Coryphaenoides rupestris]
RISDLKAQASSLQAEKRLQGEESETQVSVDGPGAKGLPGNIKAQQPERLQKPLKDKKKMSKVLEEKALVNELKVCVQPGDSSFSLPSLLKEEQAAFSSSGENLDSTSNSYPSSPALSSHKVSLKSLQAFEDYGVSEDPAELRAQVRELRLQLESQARAARQMQSLLLGPHRHPPHAFPSDLVSTPLDSPLGEHPGAWVAAGDVDTDAESQRMREEIGALREEDRRSEEEIGALREEIGALSEEIGALSEELQREKTLNRNMSEQLQNAQLRSRSASPASTAPPPRLTCLPPPPPPVFLRFHPALPAGWTPWCSPRPGSCPRLRQQIKEGRGLATAHRRQLAALGRDLRELLQTQAGAGKPFRGDGLREQLDKSLGLLERLEARLDNGDSPPDSEDGAALELAKRLSRELQEKDRQVQSLQSQLRARSPGSSPWVSASSSPAPGSASPALGSASPAPGSSSQDPGSSSSSEVCPTYVVSGSGRSSPSAPRHHPQSHGHVDGAGGRDLDPDPAGPQAPPIVGRARARGGGDQGSSDSDSNSKTRGLLLWRENGRLQEQLRGSQELNSSLRSELELHRSIAVREEHQHHQHHQHHPHGEERPGSQPQPPADVQESDACTGSQAGAMNPGLLAEHLQEIRALRQPTNIFIHGSEEQSQLAGEVRFLWEQNQSLKEELSQGSRDKHKENDKLREALARRTAKLEQSRAEGKALRQEVGRLQGLLDLSGQENAQLQDALQRSREELHRLQSDLSLQRQQLSDSQHVLRSLRVELQVCERIKTDSSGPAEVSPGSRQSPDSAPGPASGPADLSELLSEIRHLRVQLERSIHTNTALRQRLEEQLQRGPGGRSDTININYLLSTSDEGGRSLGQENRDPASSHHSSHSRKEQHTTTTTTTVLQETRRRVDADNGSRRPGGSSSGGSQSSEGPSPSSSSPSPGPPSRLVPGHRLWASRHGRHVLGLLEDHEALRRQITEGRRLTRHLDAQLQQEGGGGQGGPDGTPMQGLCSSVGSLQQVLDEAGRLLKLLWRVSLPSGDHTSNQQDRLLSGAVKRLRTTNQLKEGMERIIIDQLSVTHGVLKKARGNLEEVPINGQ